MRVLVARIGHGLSLAGCGLILLCAIVATANAIMRGALGQSIYGVNDLLALLILVGIAACMPHAMLERSHMRVTMLGQMLGHRARTLVEVFASLVTLVFFAGLAFKAVGQAVDLARYSEVSDIAGIPLAPFWWVAAAMIAAAAVLQLWITFDTMFGGERASIERGRV